MQFEIEQLFLLIAQPELTEFKKCLSSALTNTPRVSKIYDYNNEYVQSLRKFEIQHEYLIHEAVKLKSVEAMLHLLNHGASLLQKQQYEKTEYEVNGFRTRVPLITTYVSGAALYRITCFEDPALIQAAFDYICDNALYGKDSDYIEFLVTHLSTVDRSKFHLDYLKIDVGNHLPTQFEDTHDYKGYLADLGFDISKLFFFKSEYFNYLINPLNAIEAPFLQHALRACDFSLNELVFLYQTVTTEKLKWVIMSHDPRVDPELSAQLIVVEDEEKIPSSDILTRKRTRSPVNAVPVPANNYIAPHHEQECRHLLKRIATLENKISELNKLKKTPKITKELDLAKQSLRSCKKELLENPYYIGKANETKISKNTL